jgi:ATP synthase protein I
MPYHPPIPDPKPQGKGSGRNPGLVSAIVQAEKLMQIALVLPCAVFIGWLGGAWLGTRLHHPWIAIVGLVFGGIAGLVYVVQLAMRAVNDPVNNDVGTDKNDRGSNGNPR